MKNSFFKKITSACTALFLVALVPAYSVPTLTLFDGSSTVTIQDNGAGDFNSAPNIIAFNGSIGPWSGGGTATISGNATHPTLNLVAQGGTSPLGGVITLSFFDNLFGPVSSTVHASITGNTPGTANYDTFANGGLMTSSGLLTGAPFSSSQPAFISEGAPLTLEQRVTVTHVGGQSASFNALLTVPDAGTTIALLLCAFVGLMVLRPRLAPQLR